MRVRSTDLSEPACDARWLCTPSAQSLSAILAYQLRNFLLRVFPSFMGRPQALPRKLRIYGIRQVREGWAGPRITHDPLPGPRPPSRSGSSDGRSCTSRVSRNLRCFSAISALTCARGQPAPFPPLAVTFPRHRPHIRPREAHEEDLSCLPQRTVCRRPGGRRGAVYGIHLLRPAALAAGHRRLDGPCDDAPARRDC